MDGALLGPAAAGLNPTALGPTWCPITAGIYPIGAADVKDNPPRTVYLDAFELADATLTNKGLRGGLRALDGRDTVLMVETVPDRRFDIVARGTRGEVDEIEKSRLQDVLAEMGILRAVGRVGDVAEEGAYAAFRLFDPALPRIHRVTLEHHIVRGFDGDDQPALVSFYEASALAAAFVGLILPTGEMWEAAAGDLREARYLDGSTSRKKLSGNEKKLREFAHFRPAEATSDVRKKRPNKNQLYDMLGNVWEWVANRYEVWNDRRELRGCAWGDFPVGVSVELRGRYDSVVWTDSIGVRFARQDSKK